MINCCFGVVYIFVYYKGRTSGVLVSIAQSNLINGTILPKNGVQFLGADGEWEIANVENAVDFGWKSRLLKHQILCKERKKVTSMSIQQLVQANKHTAFMRSNHLRLMIAWIRGLPFKNTF